MCLFEVAVPHIFTALGRTHRLSMDTKVLKGLGEKLNAHPDQILRLRMIGVVPLLPHTPSWRAQGEL